MIFAYHQKLGHVLVGEVGIYTNRNPDTVRGADVAYISKDRLAQTQSQSYLDVAPELIVEVLSPGDSWSEVIEKVSRICCHWGSKCLDCRPDSRRRCLSITP